jgi:hypothetical protein
MDRTAWGFCAYCGQRSVVQCEHVVPRGLFPDSTRADAKFVFRDACGACNQGFSKDEEDLRNFMAIAGTDYPEAKELFFGPMERSFKRPQGKGPFFRMWDMMSKDESLNRYRVKPGPSVYRALNKIVRGLTHNHFNEVISERRVDVVVCPYEIPAGLNNDEDFIDIHPLVFRYWFVGFSEPDIHSVWLMKVLHNRVFCAMVHP